MRFTTTEIRTCAEENLAHEPKGIRFSDLCKKIQEAAPETNMNTIRTTVVGFVSKNPHLYVRPSRGVIILKSFLGDSGETDAPTGDSDPGIAPEGTAPEARVYEQQFYKPFADWIVEEGEVSVSHVVGGAAFKSKWGTPDVIGVYKPQPSDIVKFSPEIVSIEIKIDPGSSVVAFGQACAYRLFSHRTYIVMPSTIAPADQDRLDSLCEIYGVGLVLFDLNVEEPDFRFVRKPQRFTPDMYYVNDFARRLQDHEREAFDRLFW